MISLAERKIIVQWIASATAGGARLDKACRILGLCARTIQRWNQSSLLAADKRTTRQFIPRNKLTADERKNVLATALSAEFQNLSPAQIVPILADRGEYIASESTFYRVLNEQNLMAHRHAVRAPKKVSKPKSVTATTPNQLYSWDTSAPCGYYLLSDDCERSVFLSLFIHGHF